MEDNPHPHEPDTRGVDPDADYNHCSATSLNSDPCIITEGDESNCSNIAHSRQTRHSARHSADIDSVLNTARRPRPIIETTNVTQRAVDLSGEPPQHKRWSPHSQPHAHFHSHSQSYTNSQPHVQQHLHTHSHLDSHLMENPSEIQYKHLILGLPRATHSVSQRMAETNNMDIPSTMATNLPRTSNNIYRTLNHHLLSSEPSTVLSQDESCHSENYPGKQFLKVPVTTSHKDKSFHNLEQIYASQPPHTRNYHEQRQQHILHKPETKAPFQQQLSLISAHNLHHTDHLNTVMSEKDQPLKQLGQNQLQHAQPRAHNSPGLPGLYSKTLSTLPYNSNISINDPSCKFDGGVQCSAVF